MIITIIQFIAAMRITFEMVYFANNKYVTRTTIKV